MDRDSKLTEVREGFSKLFDMKINGIISPLEERRRKELAIEYLKLTDNSENSLSVEEGAHYEEEIDKNVDLEFCGKCVDDILRQWFIFFRLIDG